MNRWQLLKKRLGTRSLDNLFIRGNSILEHYSVTPRRFRWILDNFVQFLDEYGITPTLPVPASVLNRHPTLFKEIQECGAELAVHGYRHIDYTQLTLEDVSRDLNLASDVFQKQGIKYSGHRFPYLRCDVDRIDLLSNAGFQWDSSEVISWDSIDPGILNSRDWKNYQTIINTYRAVDSNETRALPHLRKNLVEIPVSVPDDDILIERLRLKDGALCEEIWEGMVRHVRDRGELLVLQFHPERFKGYRNALENTLDQVKSWKDVWTASLDEIARWWCERGKFTFEVEKVARKRYRIKAYCTDRATVLLKNGLNGKSGIKLGKLGNVMEERAWEMESPVKPMIGISLETSSDVIEFLNSEGFAHEITDDPEGYSLFLKQTQALGEKEKKEILVSAERTKFPLIRFWRWPNRSKYSFAITGDIDGVTLWDFVERFYG